MVFAAGSGGKAMLLRCALAALAAVGVGAITSSTTVWLGGEQTTTRLHTVTRGLVSQVQESETRYATETTHHTVFATETTVAHATKQVTVTVDPPPFVQTVVDVATSIATNTALEDLAAWIRSHGHRAIAPTGIRAQCNVPEVTVTGATVTHVQTATVRRPVHAVPVATSVATFIAYSMYTAPSVPTVTYLPPDVYERREQTAAPGDFVTSATTLYFSHLRGYAPAVDAATTVTA